MRLERTKDMGLLKGIFSNPEIKSMIWEEGEIELPIHQSIYYLLPTIERFSDGSVEEIPIGALMFVQMNTISWNPHIAILPEYRGNGTRVMKEGIKWMFENTPCQKILAYPPVFNKAMIRVFQKCGLKMEGYSPKSFGWRGEIYDRLLLGLEKDLSWH